MSRVIKFRVYDKDLEKWIDLNDAPQVFLDQIDTIVVCSSIDGLLGNSKVHTNAVLQQYTGVKDKNGVEIYEGDLVIWGNTRVYEVKWTQAYSGYQFCSIEWEGEYKGVIDDFYGELGKPEMDGRVGCKIVGNIFDGVTKFNYE